MTTTVENPETFTFQAEVNQVLSLVINSLYSHKEIFLRELVSNASDALDKVRFQALTDHDLLGEDKELKIQLIPDEEAGTLTIRDNGIGMSRDELIGNLGTIARSGSTAFIQALKEKGDSDLSLIGQFGVGFYSSYLVADKVTVKSRPAGEEQAFAWTSDGQGSFTVEPCELDGRGSEIILHLKEEQKEFNYEWKLRELIRKFSDFVSFPIELQVTRTKEVPKDESDPEGPKDKVTETDFEQVNSASALWTRKKDDITDEQYNAFYKHLSHDWNAPLARAHFTIEGRALFTGLVFIPENPPFDLFTNNDRRGIRLFVKRVFIMDECKELVPEYLRFIRGVVDSDDLPLNVSRELLQEDKMVRFIKSSLVKKVIDRLQEMADEDEDTYLKFWKSFGMVLKEGIHSDQKNRDKIAKLARFHSTHGDGWTSLDQYLERMKDGQKAIYYIIGENLQTLSNSPHLEALKKKGYEVLLMTDPIDEWVVMGLTEYKETKLVSVSKGDLELDGDDEEDEAKKKEEEAKSEEFKKLTDAIAKQLDDRVEKVELSKRLADSPCCLVAQEFGMHAHLERLLRQSNRDVPQNKRIFEINPDHPLVLKLRALQAAKSERFGDWVELLYAQAQVLEGTPVNDPVGFATRLTSLMQELVAGEDLTPVEDDEPEASEEADAEASEEATAEASEEATAEASEEATAEAEEASDEPSDEPSEDEDKA